MNEKVAQETMEEQESHHEDILIEKRNDKGENENENDPHAQAVKGDDSDGKVNWSIRSALTAFFLCMVYTGSQMPLYFLGGALSYVVKDLGAETKSVWLPVSYTLAAAIPVPFCGYLQDIFGRRNIAMMSAFLVIVGAILLGTAHGFSQGSAGAAIAGAGAGIAELTSLAGISEIVPVRHRGYATASLTALALPLGPYVLYCQLLASRATWRWGMWLVCIYQGIAWCGMALLYHPSKHSRLVGMSRGEILKHIDYLGGLLSVVGLTLFLVALQAGGYTHPWKSPFVLSCLIIGIATLIVFVVWEAYGAQYPVVPHVLLKRRVIRMAFVVSFVAGMFFYSLLNFIPLYFNSVYVADPVDVGLYSMGFPTGNIVGAIAGNTAISRFSRHARWVLVIGCVGMVTFGGAMISANPTNLGVAIACSTLAGLAVGAVIVPPATIAIIASPDDAIATTAALTLSIRTIGGSIGYTIFYSVFSSKITAKLPAMIAEYAITAGLPPISAVPFVTDILTSNTTALSKIPGVNEKVLAAAALGTQWAYAESLKWVFITSIPFGVVALIASLFLGDIKRYMTNRIAADLH